jgi:hypothetical protein
MVGYVGLVYGPIGAFLAEYFPGRIRYTSVSVPHHIGNGWGGGLVPFITTAAYTATGSLGYALIYPIAVPAIAFVLSLFLMPETRERSIWDETAPQKSVGRIHATKCVRGHSAPHFFDSEADPGSAQRSGRQSSGTTFFSVVAPRINNFDLDHGATKRDGQIVMRD